MYGMEEYDNTILSLRLKGGHGEHTMHGLPKP